MLRTTATASDVAAAATANAMARRTVDEESPTEDASGGGGGVAEARVWIARALRTFAECPRYSPRRRPQRQAASDARRLGQKMLAVAIAVQRRHQSGSGSDSRKGNGGELVPSFWFHNVLR